MTRLLALAADGLLRAVASNVTRLSAVAAHSGVRAVTSNVTELSAVAAHDVLVAGTLLSIGAVTSLVADLSAVVALGLSLRLLSGLYSLNSQRLHYC